MHLLVVKYDVYELESESMNYNDPNQSELYITVVEKTREKCLEAIKDKVIGIFGSYCQLNITSYIVDQALETEKFTFAHCSNGHAYV